MKEKIDNYQQEIDTFLQGCLKDQNIPESLVQAMEYSLFAGGKRIRPILCLLWSELFGLHRQKVLSFACALELIHTYSLIHDDLPAMDNDHMRRGLPTNHVRHGEAMAILAGDALLTEAFSLMFQVQASSDRLLRACNEVSQAVGPRGMVGGQTLDTIFTAGGIKDLETLQQVHSLKTGAFIRSACVSGALLAGAGQSDVENAGKYGTYIGLAFQVADDILDVIGDKEKMGKSTGKDEAMGKLTYPSLMGLEQSRQWGQQLVHQAQEAIGQYREAQADILMDLSQYIVDRVK